SARGINDLGSALTEERNSCEKARQARLTHDRYFASGEWRQSRHPGVWPPEDSRAASQNGKIPNPADLPQKLPASLDADGVFREDGREHRIDSGRSIEKVVSVLPGEGIDTSPAVFRRGV